MRTAVGRLMVRNKRRLLLVGLVMVFGLFDYVAPAVLDAAAAASLDALAYVAVGMVEGQFASLAVWTALGPHRLVARFAVALLVLAVWCGALTAGFSTLESDHVFVFGNARVGIVVLPLFLLAICAPLSMMQVLRGWRLEQRPAARADVPQYSGQFGVVELLSVTAIIAIALWLAQLGLSDELNGAGGWQVYSGLLMACLVMAAWSAFATVPAVWTLLGDRGVWKGAAILLAYAAAMTVVVVPPIKIFTQDLRPLPDIYRHFVCLHAGLLSTLLAGLLMIRSAGYGLFGRQRPT